MKSILKTFIKVAIFLSLQSCGNPLALTTSDKYVQTIPKGEHKVQIDIPEIYEMMMVVSALTEVEQRKTLFVDTTTVYYRDMITHFKGYENHALVKRLNKGFGKAFWRVYSISTLNRQAIMYDFEGGKMRYLNHYKMSWVMRSLPTPLLIFKKNKDKIEDFYQKTQFSAFYQKHKPYYDTLITQTQNVADIADIWQWLEDNFSNSKQSYRLVISPLLGGVHNNVSIFSKDKTWSEMASFISPIPSGSVKTESPAEFKFRQQRMFLSEIDESYAHVPPQYVPDLEKAMSKNSLKWNNGNAVAKRYKGSESTFNEMFTHAVMACYGHDRYETAVFDKKWPEWQNFMVEKRGFPMFKPFSDELLRLYKNRQKGQKVSDLFAPMVDWVKRNE